MNILFLAPANSIHSHKWIAYFARRTSHRIFWVSTMKTEYPLPERLEFRSLESAAGRFSIFQWVYAVRRFVRTLRPDVVHVHSVGTYGLLALLALPDGVPLALTAWGSDVLMGRRHIIKRWILKKVMSKAALITCDAQHMVKAMRGLGVPETKIKIINFGIDTDVFKAKGNGSEIRGRIGVGEAPTVVSLRSFEPIYDIPNLVRAAKVVSNQLPGVRFVLFGRGSLEGELRRMVSELGLDSVVSFGGFIRNTELADYLSAADVYVSTSLSDAGIAASTAEAMACETAVVVTDTGENSLWIDGTNGKLVPASEPEALAMALLDILRDPRQRADMAAKGRQTILERNDYETEMAKMDASYPQVRALCR
jgi:glycosyltransferase involved in cell wall biosynthesis